MAKRSSRRKTAAARDRFDDSGYQDVRLSATFDYDEMDFARAANQLCPHGRTVMTAVTFALLVLLVLAALSLEDTTPLIALVVVCLVPMNLISRWHDVQIWYAQGTTLAPDAASGRRHVVVCEDAVHTQDEAGATETYPFSEMRAVRITGDFVVMGFGRKRYVYVPRRALSENRFRELTAFLEAKRG